MNQNIEIIFVEYYKEKTINAKDKNILSKFRVTTFTNFKLTFYHYVNFCLRKSLLCYKYLLLLVYFIVVDVGMGFVVIVIFFYEFNFASCKI